MPLSQPCMMTESFRKKTEQLLGGVAVGTICVVWTVLVLPFTLFPALVKLLGIRCHDGMARRCNWLYGHVLLLLIRPWMPVRIRNADMAMRFPGSIVVCNHQSFLDLYLLAAQKQPDVCFVTKRWPFRRLFFFAPAMHSAGYIDAESLSPDEVEQRALACLHREVTLVIFPEGRRSRNGRLGKFHVGAFRLSIRSGKPVLPLIIHNSFQVAPPGCPLPRPVPIHMEFAEPVLPTDFMDTLLPHRSMMRQVRALYLQRLHQTGEA